MALTRATIKTLVQGYTGKSNKNALIESLCDLGLQEALRQFPFSSARDSRSLAGVVGASSISLTTISATLVNLLSVECVDSDGTSSLIALKPDWWWAKFSGSVASIPQGRPMYGCRQGSSLMFDRQMDQAYTFNIRYSLYPSFNDESTANPIPVLDTFIIEYVTAHIFLSIEEKENFAVWMTKAVGSNFSEWNGGSFDVARRADKDEYAKESEFDTVLKSSEKPVFFTEDNRAWYRSR